MPQVKETKTQEDLERVLKLRYKILRQPWQQPADTATDDLEAVSINAYIDDAEGNVTACGRLQENTGKTGQVRYMAVDSAQQGKGLGQLVLKHLESAAKSKGLIKIELQARENAVKFYENNGYRIKEKSFLLWGIIQHYLMEKELSY
jgi:predicted GNAT family N-acyltransferase